ncbi:efflux RND transporter periplasmic adaptor subunit [Maribellus sediminis]|uniref:efflux RND transporter periplasmic adaptor subunit n=1 Tax=Maribellus sediminis TaxID=2696285 RepID=UPI0014316C89|nr:HlyD family efflux transporter periplasmic adaptor subunit [Maribellus sediminis]
MGKNTRLIFIIAAVSGLFILLAILLLQKNKPAGEVSNESFTVEEVSMGPVISSLQASGIIESDDEIIIRSPERSIIKKVYKNAGSLVKKGDLLIELDEKSVQKEIERMQNQLDIKHNSLEKSRLNAQNTRLSLDRNEEVKKLRILTLKSNLREQEKMLEAGTIAEERVNRTRQEVEAAETDLQSQIEKNAIRIQQMEADERGLLLQINSQEKNLKEKQAMLSKLRVTAPAEGVILAINNSEGQRIEEDAMLLRMSDMSSFKVVGWVNEKYASRVQTGNRVLVNLENEKLEGVVGEITPIIEDQMIHFNVHLADKKHQGLEINQSVSLEIISRNHDNVLRIKKFPEFEYSNRQYLYVLHDREAVKTEVIFGTIGNEWCEIVSGLSEGDQILIGTGDAESGPARFHVKKSQLN